MSNQADRQDKTFAPTPRRLQKAREEGNLFRSKEIVSAGMLLVGGGALVLGTSEAFEALQSLTAYFFLGAASTPLTVHSLPAIASEIGLRLAGVMVPFFLILMAAGVGLNVMQSGWNVTLKPLAPKLSRLSPREGIKRVLGVRGASELVKALVKIAIVAPFAYLAIAGHLSEIVMLHTLPVPDVLSLALRWIVALLAQMILLLFLFSALDFAFEKWRYMQDLKMSKQEMKEELKETEGNPEVKSKRQQTARKGRQHSAPVSASLQADVLVLDPSRHAVALRYDPRTSEAPTVVAKGLGERASDLQRQATESAVPIVEDQALAQALYQQAEVMREIPDTLYNAVAAVLAPFYR